MICPKCGNELEEGKLLCEHCGEEVKIVPDFDIELEVKLEESISSVIEDLTGDEPVRKHGGFSKEPGKIRWLKILLIVLIFAGLAFGTAAVVRRVIADRRNNSFAYQYEMAVECAAQKNYADAVKYLERAFAIEPDNLDVRILLAKYYDKNGQQQNTISILEELLKTDAEYEDRDEAYDMLLGLYEQQKDYVKIGEMLKSCDVPRIVSKYNKYAAFLPEFNKQGGVYDELISITLSGNTQGAVYYTMDGTTPTDKSAVYETPILLESGPYIIRAVFVNTYGVQSDVVTRNYYINAAVPEPPLIKPDSGAYAEPRLIEVQHDSSTKVYYTTDGSLPDKYSLRYTCPIEMPYGISNFSFIAVNESGLGSEVVKRTYQLEIQANFDTELALQVLKNNLWAQGRLLNVEGNVPGKLGVNLYRVRTVVQSEDTVYYIVYEEYMDTLGETHDTGNIFAIDTATCDLYRADRVDEGKYDLMPFQEEELPEETG